VFDVKQDGGKVSPLLVLKARAEARAMLLRNGVFDSTQEAVSPLLDYANRHRLDDAAVTAILDAAFEITRIPTENVTEKEKTE
jgi:hypothetical protein